MTKLERIVDLHSHILPGVDDGATDLVMAMEVARRAVAEGIQIMVATPHTLEGVYDVDREVARGALQVLQSALAAERIPLELRLAAEVHLHESIPARLRDDPTLSLDGRGKYLLLELPHQAVPPDLTRFLFALRASGTTPLIAHPERNLAVRQDPSITRNWVEAGARLQLTAGSLDGTFGPVIRACADTLLRSGRVHVVASDTHHPSRRPPRMQDAAAVAEAVVGPAGAHTLFIDNPRRVLDGQPLRRVEATCVINPAVPSPSDRTAKADRPHPRRRSLLSRLFR